MKSHGVIEEEPKVKAEPAERVRVVGPKLFELKAPVPVRQRELFSDSLLEPSGWQRSQRRWATLSSLALQIFLMSILVIVPLMFVNVLPARELVTFLVAPAPPPPPPPPPPASPSVKAVRVVSNIMNAKLVEPSRIPTVIRMVKDDEPPASVDMSGGVVGGVPGGVAGGQMGGVIGGIISAVASRPPSLPKAVIPARVRISQGVSQGMLINRVEPQYPLIAKMARVEGTVELAAIIDTDGTIQGLRVKSGHPMLAPAALDAVKQWRYKPFLLSGQPVQVETTIMVNFVLHT